jgi:hypothetical protein
MPEYTYTLSAAERSYLRIALKALLADTTATLKQLRTSPYTEKDQGGIEYLADKEAHLAQVLFKLSREG